MSKLTNRGGTRVVPLLIIAVAAATSFGAAGPRTAAAAQEPDRRAPESATYTYVLPQAVVGVGAEGTQVPQDIRIMQRIVQTALGEVEMPELPRVLSEGAESTGTPGAFAYSGRTQPTIWVSGTGNSRVYSVGGRDVTGFYMQGYGYLFTVKWRVAPAGGGFLTSAAAGNRMAELEALVVEARAAAAARQAGEARAAGEAERALEQERVSLEERQAAWDEWSAAYREVLGHGLREVVALYGSTLKRATSDEAITFIADFGGGEEQTVTVSARRGDLTGTSRDANLAAVQMAWGESGVSGTLRTELKIMAEIIDGSMQAVRADGAWVVYADQSRYFGGDSSYQFVPGYGVLFRKSARLNIATQVIRQVNPARSAQGVNVQSLRDQIDESTEEQRQAYTEHLANLKEQTAAILATYGPTLTGMNGDDWVGVFYDVGSAAGLLEGGITNFLVQARMDDVRQAGNQTDGADWLLDRLVTNEKQD